MNPNGYDIWDVNSAAGKLIGQAHTISARHLAHGTAHVQFNREVAYYAKRIADDVALGHKTPEQGMQALLQEQRDLLNQSQAVARKSQDAIPHSVKRIPLMRLTQPVLKPDPERLLRFVHAQHLNTLNSNTQSTAKAAPPSAPVETFRFFPREQWPAAVPPPQEPGFYVVPKSTTADKLEAQLFTSPNPAVIAKFKALNPDLDQVKAGRMIVLSDPNNLQCTREEAQLMAAAEKVNTALQALTPDEADFMARHRDEIESFLTESSGAIGIGEVMFAKHLDNVKSTLEQLEALHQRTFQQHGRLQSPEFFSERQRLMSQLDNSLGPLVRKGVGIPEHPKLKSALGISKQSLVHHWRKAGVPGRVPGYATHIDGVARASKYIKLGGWVGVGLGASASALKVQEACREGREEECRQVKYAESGKFAGGMIGGAVGAPIGGAACVALSATGLGGIVCGVIMVGLGSIAGGAGGEVFGEGVGEVLYEQTKP